MKKQNYNPILIKNLFATKSKTIVLFLLFSLFMLKGAFATGMSGTYTVSGSGNYSTINAALSALKSNGVSGPVVISIAKGTYSETLNITSAITGVSSTNTITFEGAGMFNTIITSSASTVITITNCTYINFRELEINMSGTSAAYGVYLETGANYDNFTKCNITTSGSASSYTYNMDPVYITGAKYCAFDSCYIHDGGYACISNENSTGITFSDCQVTNFYYYGFYNYNTTGCTYYGNYIDTGGYNGLYSEEENGASIQDNVVPCYAASGYFNIGIMLDEPNFSSASHVYMVINNIVGPNFNEVGIYLYNTTSGNINTEIYHNTVNAPAATMNVYYYTDMEIDNSGSGLSIRNNELSRSGSNSYCFSLLTGTSGITAEDGNNIYSPGGNLVYLGGSKPTSYTTLASYQAAVASNKFAVHDMNMQPTFKSSTDLRFVNNAPEPYGPGVGIKYDIDSILRCILFPSAGASESSYGKTTLYNSISGPSNDTAYVGSPTAFTTAAPIGAPIEYLWYINGVFASNASTLDTILPYAPTLPGDSIKLIEKGCAGTDSSIFHVVVDTPKFVPITDFISSANTTVQFDTVNFYDLSTNGPSAWNWTISPDSIYNPTKVNTFSYINGTDSSSENPQVLFVEPGYYSVCLTASNAKGKGKTICKSNYITVIPATDMCSQSVTNADSGYLYDDGGPGGYIGYNVNCKLLIAPCTDTAYLVFSMFNMDCSVAFLQVEDGNGNHLNSKNAITSQKQPLNGFTGPCFGHTSPIIGDTFVSTTGNFILYETTAAKGVLTPSPGFAAYWWSKPTTFPKPTAKIISVYPANDSICLNGTMAFTADSISAPNATFLWDIDGDTTNGFEAVGTQASWPYFTLGTYTIRLVVSNCGGNDTARLQITVFNPPAPIANFAANNRNPTTADIVNFYPTQLTCVYEYLWVFTGPNGGTFTYQNKTDSISEYPQVMFNDTGCWAVTLIELNAGGRDSITKPCYIYVRQPYCVPSVFNQINAIGISDVAINTLNNKTTINRMGYNNFIATDSTTLERGLKYTLTINRLSNIDNVSIAAWIDWNGNSVFTDSGELVYSVKNDSGTSWKTTVTVPENAYLGATVMRVAMNIGSSGVNDCSDKYGDYEDYRINIIRYNVPPVITLYGGDTVYVYTGKQYVEPGYIAHDSLYGNITNQVKVSFNQTYSSANPDTFIAYYNVTDSSGVSAKTVARVIIIENDTVPPVLLLCGNDTVNIAVDSPYTDKGVCTAFSAVYGNMLNDVTKSGSVNTKVIGSYTITYKVCDSSGNCVAANRTVNVIDTIPPVITIKGLDTVKVEVYTTYKDSGVSVFDNFDTKPTLVTGGTFFKIFPTGYAKYLGIYTITYTAKDKYGNTASATRYVFVIDTIPPVITMLGKLDTNWCLGIPYIDAGYSVTDNYTPVKQIKVDTISNVNVNAIGIYSIYYTAMDSVGNKSASATRNVNITTMGNCTNSISPVSSLSKAISIYPNPGDGVFTIDLNLPANEQATITVTDMMGKTIKQISGEMGSQKQMLDISGAANGIYFVNIYAAGQSVTRKLMVQN